MADRFADLAFERVENWAVAMMRSVLAFRATARSGLTSRPLFPVFLAFLDVS